MRLTSNLLLASAVLLVACDTGRTNLGTLVSNPDTCSEEWVVTNPVRDGNATTVAAVVALDDGFVLGASPSSGAVTRVDADGAEVWSAVLGPGGEAFIKDIVQEADGGYVVTIHDHDFSYASRRKVRAVRLSSDGQVQWDTDIGPAHYMAWMEADVLLHPAGGTVVSWHDSQDGGDSPRLALARLDAQGVVLWTATHPLTEGSPTGADWAHGAAVVLGDGSILQLTSELDDLRLVRTAADGSPITDAILPDVDARPQDLLTLPDGRVLVLASDGLFARILEVEPDGDVLATHAHTAGGDSFGHELAWDPNYEALLVAGTARDAEQGWERPWTLVLDLDGEELLNEIDVEEPGTPTNALDAATIPSGGFVVTRHGGSSYYETVLPCGGE